MSLEISGISGMLRIDAAPVMCRTEPSRIASPCDPARGDPSAAGSLRKRENFVLIPCPLLPLLHSITAHPFADLLSQQLYIVISVYIAGTPQADPLKIFKQYSTFIALETVVLMNTNSATTTIMLSPSTCVL